MDDIDKAIRIMQDRGQVVSYAGLEVMMTNWHESADPNMIEAATEQLLNQGRIATLPL